MDLTDDTNRAVPFFTAFLKNNGSDFISETEKVLLALNKQYGENNFRCVVRFREHLQEKILRNNREPEENHSLLKIFYQRKEGENDWRSIRKLFLSNEAKFLPDKKYLKDILLKGFGDNITRALDILMWRDEERADFKEAVSILKRLKKMVKSANNNHENRETLLELIISGKLRKKKKKISIFLVDGR